MIRSKTYELTTEFSTKKDPLKQFAKQTTNAAVSTLIFPPYCYFIFAQTSAENS